MEKKTEKDGDELLNVLLSTLGSQQLLKAILQKMSREHNLQLPELIQTFQKAKQEASVPLSIFTHSLDPAEAIYKFLRENEGFSFQKISLETNRNQKSVWATYQRAWKKKKQKFISTEEKYYFPLSLFKDRSYSLLESIILYLKITYNLSNPQIAKLLHRSPNCIAVLMKRARDKHESP